MTYLLALDQGTSSSRSIVFDERGHIVAQAQLELPQIYPQPGWVEHDPLEIWRTQLATARDALAKAGIAANAVRAVGITNQRETTVLWNRKTGQPVHHAIVWQDRRAEPACAQLREQGHAATIQAKTGLLVDAYFSGTKLQWMLDHVPGARDAAERGELAFGTVDSWLMWKLTHGQVHVTDVSNAARTMLFNVHTNQWDDELLALLRIPKALLPEVLPSSAHFGDIKADLLGHSHPHRRRGGRPAKRAVRPGLLHGGHGQEHLWHGLLHADAHGRHVPDIAQRPAHHQRSAGFTSSLSSRWKAASSSAAPWCSGCATACAPSPDSAARCRRWPKACPTRAA
jgi:glycerol kinase